MRTSGFAVLLAAAAMAIAGCAERKGNRRARNRPRLLTRKAQVFCQIK